MINSIEKDHVWRQLGSDKKVIVLMVDDHYVHFQLDGGVKHLSKHEFIEQYQRGDIK